MSADLCSTLPFRRCFRAVFSLSVFIADVAALPEAGSEHRTFRHRSQTEPSPRLHDEGCVPIDGINRLLEEGFRETPALLQRGE